MKHYQDIVLTLKHVLKKRGFKYKDLAKGIGASEASIKRVMSSHKIGFDMLTKAIQFLGLNFVEFFTLVEHLELSPVFFSAEEETMIANDPILMRLLLLLGAGFSWEDLKDEFNIYSQKSVTRALLKLERMNVIEMVLEKTYRVLKRGPYSFASKGPVEQRYRSRYTRFFIEKIFANPNKAILFKGYEFYLAEENLEKLQMEFKKIIRQYARVSRWDTLKFKKSELQTAAGMIFLSNDTGWQEFLKQSSLSKEH